MAKYWTTQGGSILTGTEKHAATSRIEIYNTADMVTNYERLSLFWSANVATISAEQGGTGTARNVAVLAGDGSGIRCNTNGSLQLLGGASSQFSITHASDTIGLSVKGRVTSGTTVPSVTLGNDTFGSSFSASSGTQKLVALSGALNQTSTAAFTALEIAVTGTGGSGAQKLVDASYGGSSKFQVDSAGSLDFEGGISAKPVIAAQAGNYTLLVTDLGVQFNTSAAARTAALPAAASVPGKVYFIRANGANTVTIDPNASETIDGGATATVAANTGRTIMSDGTNWLSVA